MHSSPDLREKVFGVSITWSDTCRSRRAEATTT